LNTFILDTAILELFWTNFWTYWTVILDRWFGHIYSGQLDTVILESWSEHSYLGHSYSGVILDTVILDSRFGHGYSGQLFWIVIMDTDISVPHVRIFAPLSLA
jgi:hypothetical protein